jgi:hypothetical protein
MIMPAAGMPADSGDNPAEWVVLTASERGAAHVVMQTPNQDCVAFERAGSDGVVAVVADGHGHSRHLRSARGSRLAVSLGCRSGQELADRIEASEIVEPADDADAELADTLDSPAGRIAELVQLFLVPELVRRWREAVADDVAADPFTEAEEGKRRPGDDPIIAYGSTLLLCLTLGKWLILAQIGDGDVVCVRAEGTAILPVPTDPQLDGQVTTSLCGPDPVADFRIAVVDTDAVPLLAVLLATDGYGNAQIVEDWPSSFGKDLTWLLSQRDTRWLAGQLPSWAARCASADGSADDTTMALLLSPAGQARRPLMPPGGAGGSLSAESDPSSDEITIPAEVRADTVRNELPDDQETADPEMGEAEEGNPDNGSAAKASAEIGDPGPPASPAGSEVG